MKKFLAMILALAMVLGMATAAFADDIKAVEDDPATDGVVDNQATHNVNVTVNSNDTAVYKVTITWPSMDFVYSHGDGKWDPDTHTYGDDNKGWKQGSADTYAETVSVDIMAHNHSNADVTVTASWTEDTTSVDGVDVTFSNNGAKLESAAVHALGQVELMTENHVKNITMTVSGAPNVYSGSNLLAGTVTVTITPYTP